MANPLLLVLIMLRVEFETLSSFVVVLVLEARPQSCDTTCSCSQSGVFGEHGDPAKVAVVTWISLSWHIQPRI